jgi:flagellar motor protein MotB
MRNLRRSNREEEEEESVFVPMTDMTVSFLFILMILLAFFAVRISDKDTVSRSVYNQVSLERDNLIVVRDGLVADVERLKSERQKALNQITDLKIENLALQVTLRDRDKRIEDLLARIEELERRLKEQNPLEAYIAKAQDERRKILLQIEKALKAEFKDDILVEVSSEEDALRFKGEGLFASGESAFLPNKETIISRLAELMTEAISCYTVNARNVDYRECNPEGIVIEAVQIEGHTDSDDTDERNIGLSTSRANNAFFTMLTSQNDLLSYKNIRDQPVISVAGYGEMRPVVPNTTLAGKAENRRIDLRLIMYTPRDRKQVERIQQQIKDGLRLVVEGDTSSEP